MIHARVAGTGSFLPGNPVTNNDLVARGIDTSDEWVVERTGIRQRHLAAPEVTSSELAYEASVRAIAAAGLQPSDIDLIIVATSTPDYIFPSTAALLQARLGITNGGAVFDLQAVCTGFAYALATAEKFIRSGSHKRALVVGAEVFSRILDWNDRGTCVLFGDGAGAVGWRPPSGRASSPRRCMRMAATIQSCRCLGRSIAARWSVIPSCAWTARPSSSLRSRCSSMSPAR